MLDWIKREPVSFSDFAKAVVSVVLLYAVQNGMGADIASGIVGAVALGLVWFTRAAVVPAVKLSDATLAKAADMTKADIAKVEAVKADAKP